MTVVGSANADLVLSVRRLPRPGETVMASGRAVSPGGKGLNAAVAAARAGAATTFVGALGRDAEGDLLAGVLADDGIAAVVRRLDAPTGLAAVLVDDTGENSIVVSSGANAELSELTARELAAVTGAAVLLVQLEVPMPAVRAAAAAARDAGVLVVLNAAPAARLPADLVRCLDVLLVNEGEATTVAGLGPDAGLEPAVAALAADVPDVVVTLGADGALHRHAGGATSREPGRAVPVVDTTGAGDTFAGYLAAALAEGLDVAAAMRRAGAAAALSVQRAGAVPAIPTAAEVAMESAGVRPA